MSDNPVSLRPIMPETKNCDRHQRIREYSHLQEVVDNVPYLLMGLAGAAILFLGWGWLAAAGYFAYCVAGTIWIIFFVCPHCQYYATRSCPCGYGQIAARLVARKSENQFARQFRRHIPVIVPLWIVPVVAGIVFYRRGHSGVMLALLAVFAVDAFVVLPLMSRLYGCGHCPQKADCPWMLNKKGVNA
jgi:hypothetical protein